MLNGGRETRSGSIKMSKIPGRSKNWCKRAWKNCNVWRLVNETDFVSSCTLLPPEGGGYLYEYCPVMGTGWRAPEGSLLTPYASETNSRQSILPTRSFSGRRREIGTDIPLREFNLGVKTKTRLILLQGKQGGQRNDIVRQKDTGWAHVSTILGSWTSS
jgi:hypothetical protein